MPGGFVDPALPAGYSPFGIQAIGDHIYVAYANQDVAARRREAGPGLGLLDVFDTAGNFDRTSFFSPGGPLNAPWGIALAPAGFGPWSQRVADRQRRRRASSTREPAYRRAAWAS